MKLLSTANSATIAILAAAAVATTIKAESTGNTRIAGYQTKSSVTGSNIDLDQAEMERLLAIGTDESFQRAKDIYRNGANMGPYATLQLERPLREDVEQIEIIGMNENKRAVYGKLQKGHKGTATLSVEYYDNEESSPCAVGGHMNPQIEGCFAPTGGLILEGYGAVDYHYQPKKDNGFWGSLWGFSEHEAEKMFHCKDKCPYPEYEQYYTYYGQLDYGTVWIEAAFDGRSTDVGTIQLQHGSEDFSVLNKAGRAQAIQTATVTMNVFTQVNRIMTEWSVDRCRTDCQDIQSCPQAAEPWDQAVATYVGSLEGPESSGTGHGNLFYSLADQLATDFRTCGNRKNDVEGTSGANLEVLELFESGRIHLEGGICEGAQRIKWRINQVMKIPLIQGTLRSAYRLQNTHRGSHEEKGRAAAFLAAILPELYTCSHMDASIIYQEMKLANSGAPNFDDIKEAFERHYDCLGVTCEEIGGLYDADMGEYLEGAAPCGQRPVSSKKARTKDSTGAGSTTSLLFGFGRGFFLCNLVVFGILIANRGQASVWFNAAARRFQSSEVLHYANNDRSYNVQDMELSDSTNYYPIPEDEDLEL